MISNDSSVMCSIQKVRNGVSNRTNDFLVIEEPLEICLSYEVQGKRIEKSISITMRTPGNDFELALGFCYSEGIVRNDNDIADISYTGCKSKKEEKCNVVSIKLKKGVVFNHEFLTRHFYTTSSCGVCGKASLKALEISGGRVFDGEGLTINKDIITMLPQRLRKSQRVFEKTAGLHAAGLFNIKGRLLDVREDIGRHNAVDKLVGRGLLDKKLPFSNLVMMVSGRASFEIMQKALMAGIPTVVSVGAPSSLAVDIAKKFKMTLIGFAKRDSFNIYSGGSQYQLGKSDQGN